MKPEFVENYISEIIKHFQTGQAGEHAYRPAFKNLIESLLPNLQAVNDPKRSEHGAPDFIFMRSKELTAGYTETKDININLDDTEKSEQMKRYFGYDSLILTNYIEFRFFRYGESFGEPIIIAKLKNNSIEVDEKRFGELADALHDFLSQTEPIRSSSKLAKVMGGKARRIRDNIRRFVEDENDRNKEIRNIFESFKKLLIHDLKKDQFSDMYAQTLVYGLFAARYEDTTPKDFTRQEARDLIPASNPFLRHFFDHIAGPSFDDRLVIIVNELCEIFSNTDVKTLMQEYAIQKSLLGEDKEFADPVIHFYEDFLKEYDKEQRKKLGAFYTPLPVVRFIVRAVDNILEKDFGLLEGLTDTTKIEITKNVQSKNIKESVHKVQILDPAVGTGTFLNEVIKNIYSRFKNQEGRWKSYIESDLLLRVHGFELMMAPYTIAHLKIAMTLKDSGHKDFKKRLGIYLTNSLEEASISEDTLFGPGFGQVITEEGKEASKIKNETPIMVVIGNPPYSAISSNKDAGYLVDKYKVEPGGMEKLKERKNWLDDDYVKFISFAENLIDKNSEGILAYITNNGFIDNTTFRGMRWHLLKTFDDIYIVDLHGNAKKKEKSPDGSKDENVFNIMQGVSINIFVKKNKDKKIPCNVYHIDLYGKKENKFDFLNKNGLDSIKWNKVETTLPNLFFVHKDFKGKDDYEQGFSIINMFGKNVTGIVTMGDEFIITKNKKELEDRLNKLLLDNTSEVALKSQYHLGKNYAKWILENKNGNKISINENKYTQINYRPFDIKWTYYDKGLIWRCRGEVMSNLVKKENFGLVFKRGGIEEKASPVFISKEIIDFRSWSRSGMQGGDYIAPLYLYTEDGTKIPNLKKEIVEEIKNIVGETSPEDIFDYIYAVLHSLNYREKYKEFLKIDFPRVPYPKDTESFKKFVELGGELRELHLLESLKVKNFITTFIELGSDEVETKYPKYEKGKVFINAKQYFGDVPEVAWNFYIGGYQPAQKWLKDRKGRILTNTDIEHYQKIIVALVETDRIMKEIDKI
ncbi:MAG: type ISP restriction/modification enzyme [Patescibacteria group bacterium]